MELWLSSQHIAAVGSPDAEVSGVPAAPWHARRRGGLWVCAGEGEALEVVHLQDNRVGLWGGLPEIAGNLFCVWLRLV